MAKDLNQCNFIGRLGKDPERRAMPNGDSVVNLSIACQDDYKDKQGNKVEQTEWVRVTAFRGLADIIAKYCTKGSRVFISGKMKTRKYEKDGQTHYATEIIANDMQLLGGGEERGGQEGKVWGAQQANPAASQPADDFDDGFGDVPF